MNREVNAYKESKILIVLAYVCMIILGLMEAFKGAIIPSIRTEFLVDYGHIGQMLFMSSFGFLTATFFGGIAIERYGFKKVFIVGATIMIAATVLFSFISNFYGVVGIYFLLGLGVGSLEVGANTLGAKIFIKNPATMMNLMHFFFGIGAAIAPKYAGAFLQANYSWRVVYLTAMILILVVLIIVLPTKFPATSADVEKGRFSFREILRFPKIWLIAIILGLFVLMESGMASWLVNYLQEARSLEVASSTTYLTWFFATFTVGRLVGGFLVDKIGYIKSLIYFTIMATIMLFAGITLGNGFIVLFSIMGFFISIMFPTMMVVVMKEYTYGVGAVMGFVITISGIFKAVGNWLVGNINDLWGVSVGMFSLGICGVIACILLIIVNKQLIASSALKSYK